jgi:hypothetical protein
VRVQQQRGDEQALPPHGDDALGDGSRSEVLARRDTERQGGLGGLQILRLVNDGGGTQIPISAS